MNTDFLLKFVNFSEDELGIISKSLNKEKIKKDEVFLKEGEICNFIAFIEQGTLILSQTSEKGKEQILDFF